MKKIYFFHRRKIFFAVAASVWFLRSSKFQIVCRKNKKRTLLLKLRFCEKDTKFLQNHHLRFVKSTVEISQNFVALSEYMNFIIQKFIHSKKVQNKKNCVSKEVSNSTEKCMLVWYIPRLKTSKVSSIFCLCTYQLGALEVSVLKS